MAGVGLSVGDGEKKFPDVRDSQADKKFADSIINSIKEKSYTPTTHNQRSTIPSVLLFRLAPVQFQWPP